MCRTRRITTCTIFSNGKGLDGYRSGQKRRQTITVCLLFWSRFVNGLSFRFRLRPRQGSARAHLHHPDDFVGRGAPYIHPRTFLRVENLRKMAYAFGGVPAKLRFPMHRYLPVVVMFVILCHNLVLLFVGLSVRRLRGRPSAKLRTLYSSSSSDSSSGLSASSSAPFISSL